MDNINLIHGDCLQEMKKLESESIDCILTDPPYKYLKHKLDRDWDEDVFFNEAKRVLKKDGFIVLFGRGTSFYRWNTMLADLGFKFKEEVVWDKCYASSPLQQISRKHESVSILNKGNGSIKRIKIPYVQTRKHDLGRLVADVKRIKSALNNTQILNELLKYLETGTYVEKRKKIKHQLTVSCELKDMPTHVGVLKHLRDGFKPLSIIKEKANHYDSIHPTEKPVYLLQTLIKLTTNEGDTILDPFAGSASTAVACANTNRKFIGYEIDKEYFEAASKRLQPIKQRLF